MGCTQEFGQHGLHPCTPTRTLPTAQITPPPPPPEDHHKRLRRELCLTAGFFSSDPDTCVANTCTPKTTAQLRDLGYTATRVNRDTKIEYGTIGCASGWEQANPNVDPSIWCRSNNGNFELRGCREIACSGVPDELEGFDLTGKTLPQTANAAAETSTPASPATRLEAGPH